METMEAGRTASEKSVLIVDDSTMVRTHLRQFLASKGFERCREAETGREAIDVAREFKPDLIILDLMMPVMNGLEAAPVLKALLPRTPIILFTLHADFLKKQDIASRGISAVLAKTDPPDRLLEKVNELLGEHPS